MKNNCKHCKKELLVPAWKICDDCVAEHKKAYREAHKEKTKAYQIKYREKIKLTLKAIRESYE